MIEEFWADDVWQTRQPLVLGHRAKHTPIATPHASIRAPIDRRCTVAGDDREGIHSGRTIHWISNKIGLAKRSRSRL
jgi:hypothetical protein